MSGGRRVGAGRPKATVRAERVSFRFRPALLARLDIVAEWEGLTRTSALEYLVEDYFLRQAARDARLVAMTGIPMAD